MLLQPRAASPGTSEAGAHCRDLNAHKRAPVHECALPNQIRGGPNQLFRRGHRLPGLLATVYLEGGATGQGVGISSGAVVRVQYAGRSSVFGYLRVSVFQRRHQVQYRVAHDVPVAPVVRQGLESFFG